MKKFKVIQGGQKKKFDIKKSEHEQIKEKLKAIAKNRIGDFTKIMSEQVEEMIDGLPEINMPKELKAKEKNVAHDVTVDFFILKSATGFIEVMSDILKKKGLK